jgi:hypothetical protein
VTGNVAAFRLAKITILDALEYLGLRSQNRVLRFRNVAVDDCCERGVLFSLESAGTLQLGFAFDDPGISGLPALKALRFAMEDCAPFFNDDLSGKGL